MQIVIGLVLAIGCAIGTNVAAVLKHRGCNDAPAFSARHPLRSARLLLRSRWFAIGFALALVAGAAHIVAMTLAPISDVQVVLAAGVMLLATLAGRLLGATIPRRQRLGLYAAGAGLALLVACAPRPHGAHSTFDTHGLLAFEGTLVAIGLLLASAPYAKRFLHHRGTLLGACAGICFGFSDVAIKATSGMLSVDAGASRVAAIVGVAIVGGLIAQFLVIRGLQQGEAVPVIALTGLTANVANITGGIVVFGDPLAHGTLGVVGQALALVLVVVGSALVPAAAQSLARDGEPALAHA